MVSGLGVTDGENTLRSLAGRSVAYLAGGVAGKALALVTLPLLARLLTPAQLGILDVGSGLATLLATVAVMGVDNSIPRFLPASARPGPVWSSAFTVVAVAAVAIVVVGLAASDLLARLLLHDATTSGVMAASVLYAAAVAAFITALTVLRLRASARRYPLATTGTLVLQMVGAVVIAAFTPQPLVPILMYWALVSAMGALAIVLVSRPPLARPDPHEIVRLAKFGLPLVPAVIAWSLGDLGIRSLLASRGDLANLGSYSIASRLVSVMALGISGFSLAWMPFIFRSASIADAGDLFRRAAVALSAILGLVGIGLAALAPEAVALLAGHGYASAPAAVAPLAGGMLVFGLFTLLIGASGIVFRTADVAWISTVGAVVQIGAAWVLVHWNPLLGAGVASFLGYATALALLRVRLGRQLHMSSPTLFATLALAAGLLSVSAALVAIGTPLILRSLVVVAGAAVTFLLGAPLWRRQWGGTGAA
ncbi:MAG TPA: lipopolysaccharide biosynthesis protein [Burkholderiaceae bacterium]